MQVESFKVFRDLVESQSFSKAAQMNNITQSAVSQQIRSIEEKFHVPFIERSSKRFALTREGDLLYQTSREIVSQYEALHHQLNELRNIVCGNIRIATVYSIGLHELPPYMKKFLKEFPNVNVHVEYRRSNQVYEEVQFGTCDLGLVAFPAQKKNIKSESFKKDRLVVITASTHPLAEKEDVEVTDLAPYKLIGFEPDIPTRRAVDKIFRDVGIEPRPVMEFDNIETVKRAVEIDAGISIVPRATVEQERKSGSLSVIEFKNKPFYRPLAMIYKSGRVLSPALKRFLKTLKEPLDSAYLANDPLQPAKTK